MNDYVIENDYVILVWIMLMISYASIHVIHYRYLLFYGDMSHVSNKVMNISSKLLRNHEVIDIVTYIVWIIQYTLRATPQIMFRYMFPIYVCFQTKVMFPMLPSSKTCLNKSPHFEKKSSKNPPRYGRSPVSNIHFLLQNANDVSERQCFQCMFPIYIEPFKVLLNSEF